jgi:hypothetical protein
LQSRVAVKMQLQPGKETHFPLTEVRISHSVIQFVRSGIENYFVTRGENRPNNWLDLFL